jgi:capsular polysaccharide export protein
MQYLTFVYVGLSPWKKKFIPKMVSLKFKRKITNIFVNNINEFLKIKPDSFYAIVIWGNKLRKRLEDLNHKENYVIFSVEDGFIRSVGLGSNFVKPQSIILDSKGIYYNCTKSSDLEFFLNHHRFTNKQIQQGNYITKKIIRNNISKYNLLYETSHSYYNQKKKICLVIGQVEDDASIEYGSFRIKKNIDLLKLVRKLYPKQYIIFKPHPDVLIKNRKGGYKDTAILKYADFIEKNANITFCIKNADSVHTITSLSGFEALLRGKTVHVYGAPFYSGWGLTEDYFKGKAVYKRRKRKINIPQLVYASLIYYSFYYNYNTTKIVSCIDVVNDLGHSLKKNTNFKLMINPIIKNFAKLKNLTSLYKESFISYEKK